MNFNDRSDYLEGIASNIFGIEYYLNDYSSTGIMILDLLEYYDCSVFGNTYKCLMLNDAIEINQGLQENIYTERPETSVTDYTKADKTDQKINQTYIIVDKQNQKIESVVSNVSEQNNKISRIQQTVDTLNSKISDIADITTSQETNTGKLIFDNINQSEPIHVEIHPISENITFIYPRNNLYISNTLFIQLRRLKFTNTTTGEIFYYELPADLLYYDSNNFDTFIMDYDSLTCFVNKKCEYDTNGNVVLLAQERIDSYPFTHLEITDGDYEVEVLKYDNSSFETLYNCYLFARLMTQNQYTSQYATKAELHSEINQTTQEITASVNNRLSNYSTTTQMNAQIQIKANEITNNVSETYETKEGSNTKYSQLNQRADQISTTVSGKVGNDEIISKINQSAEAVQIQAGKISLDGKNINLTSGNIIIQSDNFNVDKYGNMSCNNANVQGTINSTNGNIGGWSINNSGLTNGAVFVRNDGVSTVYTVADLILIRNYIMGVPGFEMEGSIINHYDFNGDGRVSSSDYVTLKNLLGISPDA